MTRAFVLSKKSIMKPGRKNKLLTARLKTDSNRLVSFKSMHGLMQGFEDPLLFSLAKAPAKEALTRDFDKGERIALRCSKRG
jgi:hypothetical protein